MHVCMCAQVSREGCEREEMCVCVFEDDLIRQVNVCSCECIM